MKESDGGYSLQDHYDELEAQIQSDLYPVLGERYPAFNFDEVYQFVLGFKQ